MSYLVRLLMKRARGDRGETVAHILVQPSSGPMLLACSVVPVVCTRQVEFCQGASSAETTEQQDGLVNSRMFQWGRYRRSVRIPWGG